jgi:hypothetical protein
MRKQRITQQQRISNIEKSVYVLALRLEQLTKQIQNDPQDTTNTDSHDSE